MITGQFDFWMIQNVQKGFVSTLCFFVDSQPFEYHQQECLSPESQIAYPRWSISRFESTMGILTLRQTKSGEFIKEEPHTTALRK